MPDLLDPDDISPLDRARALPALDRYALREVVDPADPAFDAGWEMLAAFFYANGELEDREVLRRFIRERRLVFGEDQDATYHFITAWDGDELVGVRDCYVDIDHRQGVCVAALSHSFVAPAHRRTGLAALLRALPVTLVRTTLQERLGRQLPTLIAAEMEPADPTNPDTVVRLLAYGRSGFSVLDPRRLPYSQPEFRDLPDADHTGIALLPVVRPIGAGALSPDVVQAFPELFHACHLLHLPADRVEPSRRHALAALRSAPEDVALLPLPTSVDTLAAIAPLVRGAVLPLYPRGLRGPRPEHGDAAAELMEILRYWG
jgi:GNAT superfamily N-acetyltransferase